jgi:iron(III) transport system ATP-binding protein
MRSGKLAEIGDPKKIYFDAESAFVADFIGRSNLIPATIVSDVDGASGVNQTVAKSSIGTFTCKKADFPPGTEVTLCLRPEFIRPRASVESAGSATKAVNQTQGVIETLLFIGDAYEGEIRVEDTLLMARLDPDTNFKIGDTVIFDVPPEQCLLVAK